MTGGPLARLVPALVLAAAIAGCGSSGGDRRFDLRTPTVRGTPTAVPGVVSDGVPPVKITTRRLARRFNKSLSCGAKVIRLRRDVHHQVVTTFRRVNRTGPGARPCGGGGLARASFRVEHGRITQWFRLPDPPDGGSPPAGEAS